MGKFQKGVSGNPAGRKRGTGYADKLREAISNDLPDIIGAMVAAAKGGDVGAATLLMNRVIPTLKPIQEVVTVTALEGEQTLSEKGAAVITTMADGKLSSEQAQNMLAALASLSKIREVDEIERRISALEESRNDA
jgi:hypothetical protein